MTIPARRRGFSLIEMVISVGLLASAALLVLGITTSMFYASQKSVDLTTGTVLANSLLKQQAYQVLYDNDASAQFFQQSHDAPTLLAEGTYTLNTSTFHYKIYVQDLSLSTALSSGGKSTRMKRLDALVSWWEEGGNNRAAGLLQVASSRMLWPTARY
jgi:prepilin-type N-terminal cleavage/methylation domain-containing protein